MERKDRWIKIRSILSCRHKAAAMPRDKRTKVRNEQRIQTGSIKWSRSLVTKISISHQTESFNNTCVHNTQRDKTNDRPGADGTRYTTCKFFAVTQHRTRLLLLSQQCKTNDDREFCRKTNGRERKDKLR